MLRYLSTSYMTPRTTQTSGIHTWLVLMKAHRTLQRHARRSIEALEMCLSDFAILEALLHKGPQSVKELGRRMMDPLASTETKFVPEGTDHEPLVQEVHIDEDRERRRAAAAQLDRAVA